MAARNQSHQPVGMRRQSYDTHVWADAWFVVFAISMRNCTLLLVASLWLISNFAARGQDWLGFHGLEQQGVSHEAASVPGWSRGITPIWKTAIPGLGFSSPVVAGDQVYLTTAYETNRGAGIKSVISYVTATLAVIMLAVIGLSTVRSLARDWPVWHKYLAAGRGFLMFGIILFVLGITLFGQQLLGLDESVHRSWKVATVVAALSLYLLLLLAGSLVKVRLIFVGLSTLLSLLAYLFMPKREQFLNFSSSDGLISTSMVVLPLLLAWGVFALLSLLSGRRPAHSGCVSTVSPQVLAVRVAFSFGLPLLLAALFFWGLMQRVIKNGSASVSYVPAVGWTYVAVAVTICLAIILAGGISGGKVSRASASLVIPSAGCATLLAFGCFYGFACLPAQKQVAFAVVCLERTTGQIQWLREVAYQSNLRDLKEINSLATPTLAMSSNLMCAYFGPAGLYGLDDKGNVQWHVEDLGFQGDFGVGQSPTLADGVVVLINDYEVPRDRPAPKSQIAAYNLADGQLLWRHERTRREPGSAGFATPIVRNIRGDRVVLVRGWEDLTAYDLHTGKVRWTYPLKHRGHHLVASLVSDEKRLYVMDATRVMALAFDALDAGRADFSWVVPVPGEKDSTPVVIDRLLFAATETGVLACIDVESGDLKWKQKLRSKIFASVVALGDGVLFAGESGDLSLAARSGEFTQLFEYALDEKIYATPTPLGDGVLLRTAGNLYCLRAAE